VARICQDTRERYRAWCARRLEQPDLVYLFLDARCSPRAPKSKNRPISGASLEAADGIRTHDLLHGKQTL
jgi:hypothetical protein